tara:strand:+ start:40618 stop:42039 length:1422 start_codon:yes stop_codon:yes gene_type:complete
LRNIFYKSIQIKALSAFFYILILIAFDLEKVNRFFLIGFAFCVATSGFSQQGFHLPKNQKKDKIPFELVNNLTIIPVTVNGKELNFLLDTGVKSTLIFSLTSKDSLEMKNAVPVRIRGLGEGGTLTALKSANNQVVIGEAVDENHTIFVVFDESLNFSTRMGIPINGIIGYDLFKNFIVKTDYSSRKITLYNTDEFSKKKLKRYEAFKLSFYKNKPYTTLSVFSKNGFRDVTLLIDSGSSDAMWLFNDEGLIVEEPKNYFEDYLGLGLSGNIFGKRSRLKSVKLKKFELANLNVAFPNLKTADSSLFYKDRDGSLGGGILKRFTVIMDYNAETMYLKKNKNFKLPFHYNMSGLIVEHDGLVVVKSRGEVQNQSLNLDQTGQNNGAISISVNPLYSFTLAPRFVVAEVRKNSPAALAGLLKGDEILMINGKQAHKYKLYELTNLFSSKVGKKIYLKINREGVAHNIKFELEKVL